MEHPFAISLDAGTSLLNHTGSWRTSRPVYVDRLPPCNHACPAGENIQDWLSHAETGDYENAWRVLTQDNPLPAVMGRVCYHPCETACNRAQIDEAVGINSVERFLGDEAIRKGWKLPPAATDSGKRVLVVGAGPSGLSAAYHLRRLGHAVEIYEAGPIAGGMMRFGIPKYRLPRDVLDAEIARIVELGVSIHLNVKVVNILEFDDDERLRRGFSRGRRAHRQARIHPGGGSRQNPRRCCRLALHGRRGKAAARPARRCLWRRQHRARCRAYCQAARRNRCHHRLPPHPRPHACPRFRAGGGARRRRDDEMALDHQTHGRRSDHGRENGPRRDRVPAADRRIRNARGRFARTRARARCRSVAPQRLSPVLRSRTAWCRSDRI